MPINYRKICSVLPDFHNEQQRRPEKRPGHRDDQRFESNVVQQFCCRHHHPDFSPDVLNKQHSFATYETFGRNRRPTAQKPQRAGEIQGQGVAGVHCDQ